MKRLVKIVTGWTQLTIFVESSILDVPLGFDYVSDNPETFSITIT